MSSRAERIIAGGIQETTGSRQLTFIDRWRLDDGDGLRHSLAQFSRTRALVGKALAVDIDRLDRSAFLFFFAYLHSQAMGDDQPGRDCSQDDPGYPSCIERHREDAAGCCLLEPEKNGHSAQRFRKSRGDTIDGYLDRGAVV